MRTPARRICTSALSGVAALVLSGCLATSKHVEVIEQEANQQKAWNDERYAQMESELESVKAENEALRVRLDDLSDQFSGLGGEVASRLHELSTTDEEVSTLIRQAQASADAVDTRREQDRDELIAQMNVILEEVLKENAQLAQRLETLESSALTFGRVHTVKPGESVASIASKYGISPEDIAAANQLPDANMIRVGQELVIP